MARSVFAFLPLIFTAAAIVFLVFVIVGGVSGSAPFNKDYFLSIDLSTLPGGKSGKGFARWTLWQVCNADDSGSSNANCGKAAPAFSFDISQYLPADDSIYDDILNQANFYYYMTRFAFAFYLIALTFASLSLFTGLLALCSRLGGAISSFFGYIALFFALTAACLMTAWTVTAKNQLSNHGISASLGAQDYGFTWGAVGALILSSTMFCCVACSPRRRNANKEFAASPSTTSKRRFWQRKDKTAFDTEHTANGSY